MVDSLHGSLDRDDGQPTEHLSAAKTLPTFLTYLFLVVSLIMNERTIHH